MSASNSESLTQRWLRQNIQSYPSKDIVFAHVDSVLLRWSSIRPKTDIYTYNDGRTQLLLCLHGLLPISYRGTPYNIPIAIWVTKDYPRLHPIAYVVPTPDMLVRSGKYMDVSGRCEIEYLQHWQRKSEGCNLSALLEAMQEHFSKEPPVYARPRQSSTPQPQARPNPNVPSYSDRSPPPLPTETRPSPPAQPTPVSITRNDDRPPLPLKPGASPPISVPSALSPVHPPQGLQSQPPKVVGQINMAYRPPPPLPPHPPSHTGLPQGGTSPPVPPRYLQNSASPSPPIDNVSLPVRSAWSPDTPASSTTPHASSSTAHAWPSARNSLPPQIPATTSSVPPSSTVGTQSHQYLPPQPPPLSVSPLRNVQPQSQYTPPPPPPPFVSPQATGVIRAYSQHTSSRLTSVPQPALTVPTAQPTPPAAPVPDLLDDDDLSSLPTTAPQLAPAPPRPPNPELLRLHSQVHLKIQSELASLSQTMALDAEKYRAQQSDLLAGEPAIVDEMGRLEAVRDVCNTVASRLRVVVQEAEFNVAELKRKGDPEVDELVCSTTIVHNQLINLVAEDNAIEDTIYHLHRALNSGRIDLERFLRTTRVLAEEQFMKRALIEKILTGIPMGGSMPMSISSDWR